MWKARSFSLLISAVVIIASGSQAEAQKRILVLNWNVESGDKDSDTIKKQLEDFEGFDILGSD